MTEMTPETFKTWRKSLRLSQKATAEALDVSPRRVWGFEHGEFEIPRHIRLAMAAMALGLKDWPS